MYWLKNKKDISSILKFHRAKDMVNIMNFFPRLSPIDDLAVILDEEDYLKNKEKISHLTSVRNGNPVNELCMKSIPTKEINPDYIEIIKEIKKENPKGVLILFHLNINSSERYEREAGISVGISLGRNIYIDAVGKGFDGREVLKGISCHERYIIPWEDIRKVNINNFKEYNTFLISQENYLKSREERINYLISCGLTLEVLEQKIPKEYKTTDPKTGKKQAFAGSLGIAPGGTTLLTEGMHFIIDSEEKNYTYIMFGTTGEKRVDNLTKAEAEHLLKNNKLLVYDGKIVETKTLKDAKQEYRVNYHNSYTGRHAVDYVEANNVKEALRKFGRDVALRGDGTANINVHSISPFCRKAFSFICEIFCLHWLLWCYWALCCPAF